MRSLGSSALRKDARRPWGVANRVLFTVDSPSATPCIAPQINSDTTQSAIASSADTAAAAAAAAAAATIPSLHHLNLGVDDIVAASDQKKKMDEAEKLKRLEDAKVAMGEQFHPDVKKWRVRDVCRWLDTLTLGQVRRLP